MVSAKLSPVNTKEDSLNLKQRAKRNAARNIAHDITDGTKKCNGCTTVKNVTEFGEGRRKCKLCIKQQDTQRYDRNKAQYAKKGQEYLDSTKECNKCKKRQPLSEFNRSACKTCESKRRKEYRKAHKDEVKEYNREYNLANRPAIQARQTVNQRRYRATMPQYKITQRLRQRVKAAVKGAGGKKSEKTMVMLGCSIEFLLKWFEFRFSPGMTLQSYGNVWHIDHVIPCTIFSLEEDEEQQRCFHWTNLQPMDGLENMAKGNRTSRDEVTNQLAKIDEFILAEGKNYVGDYTLKDYDRYEYL